jgi:hypothetical protein
MGRARNLGVELYNPENLELPNYDDPRLTDYFWEYSVGTWTHVIAFNSEEWEGQSSPEADFEFSTPFHYSADFHLLMWPDLSYQPLPNVSFDFGQLDPTNLESSLVRSQIASLLELDKPDSWLDGWLEEAESGDCNKLIIQRWQDVRFEWRVRGWEALTLEHLKANLRDLEFSKSFSSSDGSLLLETFQPDDSKNGFESFRYEDSEFGARFALSAYQANPSTSLALEAAGYLHRFGGPELAAFHFPGLELCRSCGEQPHPMDSAPCESRLDTLRF